MMLTQTRRFRLCLLQLSHFSFLQSHRFLSIDQHNQELVFTSQVMVTQVLTEKSELQKMLAMTSLTATRRNIATFLYIDTLQTTSHVADHVALRIL